jgi:hypothetical protein
MGVFCLQTHGAQKTSFIDYLLWSPNSQPILAFTTSYFYGGMNLKAFPMGGVNYIALVRMLGLPLWLLELSVGFVPRCQDEW